MLMNHPFNFRIGGANITLTTNDDLTTVLLHNAGVSKQQCNGKFVAVCVDMRAEDEVVVLSLLTTTGEYCYVAYLIEIDNDGNVGKLTVPLRTDKDLMNTDLTVVYDSVNELCTITSPSDSTLVYAQESTKPTDQQ